LFLAVNQGATLPQYATATYLTLHGTLKILIA